MGIFFAHTLLCYLKCTLRNLSACFLLVYILGIKKAKPKFDFLVVDFNLIDLFPAVAVHHF
jgi:hypothetical protein